MNYTLFYFTLFTFTVGFFKWPLSLLGAEDRLAVLVVKLSELWLIVNDYLTGYGRKKKSVWMNSVSTSRQSLLSLDYGSSAVCWQNMKVRRWSVSRYNRSNVSAISFSNLKRAPRDCEGGLALKSFLRWRTERDPLRCQMLVSFSNCLGSLNPCNWAITGTIKMSWYDLGREHKLTKVSTWALSYR